MGAGVENWAIKARNFNFMERVRTAFEEILGKMARDEITEITPSMFEESLKPDDALRLAQAIRSNTSCSKIDLGAQLYVGEDIKAISALSDAVQSGPGSKTLSFYDMLAEQITYATATPRLKIDAASVAVQPAIANVKER